MKKMILLLGLSFMFVFYNTTKADLSFSVNFGYFYNTLSPYGSWLEIETGVYVWKPDRMINNWQPYSVGRWVWTDDGWYWDSFEEFGDVTYHYGRWYFDDYYGWLWYPGYDWAPAWVEWRYDDDYVGWAPLPPYAMFSAGRGIVYSLSWNAPLNYWYFVRYRHFCNDNMFGYGVSHEYKKILFRNTKTRNNYDYRKNRIVNNGINRDFIENKGGYRIAERKLVDVDRFEGKVNNNEVKRFIPKDEEVKRYNGVTKYDAKNSIGRTSLKLDRVVDENYTIDKNVIEDKKVINGRNLTNDNGSTVKREKVYINRNDGENVKRDVNNKNTERNTSFENRKNIEQKENREVKKERKEYQNKDNNNTSRNYEPKTQTRETKSNDKNDVNVNRNNNNSNKKSR